MNLKGYLGNRIDKMAVSSTSSSLALSHLSDCDCTYCQNNASKPELGAPENWYKNISDMARATQDRKDYFDSTHDTASDSEHDRRNRDEQIRKAPYLSKVQIWAREKGPYTLRVGDQWFHCDDLIINGSEYGQRNRPGASKQQAQTNSSVYPPPKSSRPTTGRGQSYQRSRPEQTSSSSQYQPQTLPTPKEQAAKRRSERKQQEALEAEKLSRRERRDSGTAMLDEKPAAGALVPYSNPPPTQAAATATSTRPSRPAYPRRGSSRNGSYSIPVRSKGRKNVRFAPLPR